MTRGGLAVLVVGVAAAGAALALSLRSSSSSKRTPPALPSGWTRYRGFITPALRGAALVALRSDKPIGSVVELHINGRTFGAFIEWHDDKTKGQHRGVSLLVPKAAA